MNQLVFNVLRETFAKI